jgi:hypothetical protein
MKKQTFFRLNFSDKFMRALCQEFKEGYLNPDESFHSQEMFIFVNSGEVFSYYQKSHKKIPIRIYQKGDMIGLDRAFSNEKLRQQYTTNEIVLYSYLSFEDFYRVLAQFPDDVERYHQLKHEVEILDSFSRLDIVCRNCGYSGHTETRCSLINLCIPLQILAKRNNRPVKQKRTEHRR